MDYTIERLEGEINLHEYLQRFRDEKTFMECCKVCDSFMKRWHCPPLGPDFEIDFSKYSRVRVVGCKIIPRHPGQPGDPHAILKAHAAAMNKELRNLEKTLNGRAMGLAQIDGCFCAGQCTRPLGEPCRHPDLVRPALEAYGFDVCKTAKEILGLELLWSRDGILPAYLSLVGAVVY